MYVIGTIKMIKIVRKEKPKKLLPNIKKQRIYTGTHLTLNLKICTGTHLTGT